MDEMKSILMQEKTFTNKTVCIVLFGPASNLSGIKPGTYFQVTIDPKFVSPSGEYIRFGQNTGDELIGWQKISMLTVVEVLGEWVDDQSAPIMAIGSTGVTMLFVE